MPIKAACFDIYGTLVFEPETHRIMNLKDEDNGFYGFADPDSHTYHHLFHHMDSASGKKYSCYIDVFTQQLLGQLSETSLIIANTGGRRHTLEARAHLLAPATYWIMESGGYVCTSENGKFVEDKEWTRNIEADLPSLNEFRAYLVGQGWNIVGVGRDRSIRMRLEDNPEKAKGFFRLVKNINIPEGIMYTSNEYHIDFFPNRAGKWNALRYALEKEHINLGEVAAVGNDTNDIPILEKVGHPYVLGDGTSKIRYQAEECQSWFVSNGNNFDGINEILLKILSERLQTPS